ncbi:MAG: hypothetical protein AAFQ39_01385 [Pseudomonadota bacterium]
MAARQTVSYPDLKGSEQHHDLKNQPGEDGDPDHADTDGALSPELEEVVESTDASTQIADKLKRAVDDDS